MPIYQVVSMEASGVWGMQAVDLILTCCVSFEVASLRLSQPDASARDFLRFGRVCKNPSLTLRVMINSTVFATMFYLMRYTRNLIPH
jgi:hypothetical protein